jgi:hypothetical protein
MSVARLGMFGGFFLLMMAVALVTTGVLQHNILPRFGSGAKAHEATAPAAGASPPAAQPAKPIEPSADHAKSVSPPQPDLGKPVAGAVSPPGAGPSDAGGERATEAAAIKRLSRMYEGMRPKEAAGVLEKLDRGLAAEMLGEINHRHAAKILAAMQPAAAAELTNQLRRADGKATP